MCISSNFLKKFFKFFENSPVSVWIRPPEPLVDRSPKMFPRIEILAVPLHNPLACDHHPVVSLARMPSLFVRDPSNESMITGNFLIFHCIIQILTENQVAF